MTDEATPTEITYDEFQKIDLRIGKVIEADRVPKSTKLLRMLVNFGAFQRQILAGVGETFEPFDLIGKQFMFVINLAPRKMMGLESHGMMLATGPESKTLSLVSLDEEVPDGSKVG
jgi:methionyl-tRNA synthetase